MRKYRVIKLSQHWHRVYVNSELSADPGLEPGFALYVNPYMTVSHDGRYTKHIYAGEDRVLSKIGNPKDYPDGDPTKINFGLPNGQKGPLEGLVNKNNSDLDVKVGYHDAPAGGSAELGLTNDDDNMEVLQYYYTKDHLGSSTIISDIKGKPIQQIEYTAFGESFADWRTEDWNTPYRFTGKEQDAETGLYYYGARYYDPYIGRFLSVDPLAEKFGNESPYVYAGNNPLFYKDADGREKIIGLDINKKSDQTIISGAEQYNDDGAIHIFGHGSTRGMTLVMDGKIIKIRDAKQLNNYLNKYSKTWQNKGENNPMIVLHSCNTGKNQKDGSASFAEKVSDSKLFEKSSIIAPNERVYTSENGEVGTFKAKYTDDYGNYKTNQKGEIISKEQSNIPGSWRIFKNGKQTGQYRGDWKPKEEPTFWDNFTKKQE